MLIYFLMCNILSSLALGNNLTLPQIKFSSNKTLTFAKDTHENNIKTNVTLLSEGGSIIQETPVLTLPKENHTILMSLDKELGKNKEKPVVARKGAVFNPVEDNISVSTSSIELKEHRIIGNKSLKENNNELDHHVKIIKKLSSKTNFNENNNTTNVSATSTVKSNKTMVPKKPLLLSYEALSNMDHEVDKDQLKIPAIKSSTKTMVDQMPSPNKNGPSIIIKPMSTNRHPGMIMPIVITILVVPMFAVLGYMALRRGQEAWKNRHYKRMDFLLDGMYND